MTSARPSTGSLPPIPSRISAIRRYEPRASVSRYLVDNSVLQRLPRSPEVQAAVTAILDANDELCCCSLSLDEFAFSARSSSEHEEGSRRLRTSFLYLPVLQQPIRSSSISALRCGGPARVARPESLMSRWWHSRFHRARRSFITTATSITLPASIPTSRHSGSCHEERLLERRESEEPVLSDPALTWNFIRGGGKI